MSSVDGVVVCFSCAVSGCHHRCESTMGRIDAFLDRDWIGHYFRDSNK